MQIFNTLTNRKEELAPLTPGKVGMYNCGPTVYNFATIGNFRSFIFADVLRRTLEYFGHEVTQVMNITDVGHMVADADEGEDKMQKAAREEKKDPWQIAESYMNAFFEDIDALGIRRAHQYPRATEHIDDMIQMIEALIARGHAYEVNGNVYYDVTSFPGYGTLSGNTIEQLNAGARIEVNPEKRNAHDFALWKQDTKHIMQWDSPWGRGFPGWHIECSAMSSRYLGDQFDIHTGGEDNIFPHHESEIAQSEGATGKTPWVKYWMHARFLLVEGQKMSKSLGNFYTLRDLIAKGCDPMAVRYVLMSTHYRQPVNFTLEGVDAAKTAIQRLKDFRIRLKEAKAAKDNPALGPVLEKGKQRWDEALGDDLNTSAALAALFDMVRDVNKLELSAADAQKALDLLTRFDSVMGVMGTKENVQENIVLDVKGIDLPVTIGSDLVLTQEKRKEAEELTMKREEARRNRNFAVADELRNCLKAKGIVIEDVKDGVRWKKA